MGATVKWKPEDNPWALPHLPDLFIPVALKRATLMESLAMPTSFHGTLGAASIGFYFSCVVFGILTTQMVVYFQRFPKDRLLYKLLVAILWYGICLACSAVACYSGVISRLLELADQVFIGYSIYYYAVTHYGQPQVFGSDRVIFTLVLQIIMGNLVGTIVKLCFAMRVWRFSKRNVLITGTIVFLVLGEFALAIVYSVRAFQLSLFEGQKLQLIASLALAGGFLTDFAIAGALCMFLRKMRTGHKKADTLVNTLTIYAINTGVLTGAISLLTLILYNSLPSTLAYMASYFTLGKLYAISFLATLNTRKVLRGRGTDAENTSEGMSNARNTFFMVTNSGRGPRNVDYKSHLRSVEIDVRKEVSIVGDVDDHAAQDVSLVNF
ncbi:hypothetical protein BDN70DRAFT_938129 [Pholiota conissans]|uniref:DUF6534 domain-containing protein n=1 Tax=Pholiota conissans TaxID=109636 RepID=A0A9P5YRC6_9AGAR|nr:hypothetical protein BDN70DRAFT_938129 [Pholiota conissans]